MGRIAWVSNSIFTNTGYGTQTRHILPRFVRLLGHEVANIGFYGLQGGILNWSDGIRLYPQGYEPYGSDVIDADSAHFKADMAIAFLDSWVVQPQLVRETPLVFYYPVDHEEHLPNIIREKVGRGFARINYSKHGQRLTEAAGLDSYYVPHCVDTQVFKPMPQAVARANVIAQSPGNAQGRLAQDAFVVGMVAANKGNPSRKCFQHQLEAFAELHRRHPDTQMYLHTIKGTEQTGLNIPEFVEYLGLTDCVFYAEQYLHYLGMPDGYVNEVYNAFDVLTNVSMGEGFGLAILEAQAAGTPVITGDWTSMGELTFAGWKVDKRDTERFWSPLASWQLIPHVGAIVDAMEAAYLGAGNARLHQEARKGAIAYDADDVVKNMWGPVLADILRKIEERKSLAFETAAAAVV
mgnify:CR=1 FL=1